jgi:ferrous-iron efflux pump FieF
VEAERIVEEEGVVVYPIRYNTRAEAELTALTAPTLDESLSPLLHQAVSQRSYIRTRVAGPTAFIQLHIEMDGEMNLLRAHEISDDVEARLQHAFPHAEIIIHEDPAGIDERVTFPARTIAQ